MDPQAVTGIALQPVLTGLSQPVYVTHARDGSNRLFVVEQAGRILVLQPGASAPTAFLDIRERVLSGSERGLLGLAFHPQFPANRRFFVNYTRRPDGATVIAEYHASTGDPNVADTAELVWLLIRQPFANHNGGMIEFGPDGLLYIASGDGGSANDPGNRAQNPLGLLGKILRIAVDGDSSPSTIGPAAWRPEIFALGFRNPWRFSFDRATGQLYVGDVGQGAWEEIDIVVPGGNYGWRVFEGDHCTNLDPPLCNNSAYIGPIAEYAHASGRCSVTGGYVYRGTIGSLPVGGYVYGDYCSGEIFLLRGGVSIVLLNTTGNISSFGEDEAGEIYVVDYRGTVHRIVNPVGGGLGGATRSPGAAANSAEPVPDDSLSLPATTAVGETDDAVAGPAGEGTHVAEPAVPLFGPVAQVPHAPALGGACECALWPREGKSHQAVTAVVESASRFFGPPYDPAAALDGDDLDDYAAHLTFGDYPNWFVVGLSSLIDLYDLTIRWGSTELYGRHFEVWALRDTGAGFEWVRVVQEVDWSPNGSPVYIRQFPSPYQRVCKLMFVVREAAGQARMILRRFAWNQLNEFGATVTDSSRFFRPPWDILAALDGRNDSSDYAAPYALDSYPNWFELALRRRTEIQSVQVHWYSAFYYGTDFRVLALRGGQWMTIASETSWAPPDAAAVYNRVLSTRLTDVEGLAVVVLRAVGQSRAILRQFSWNRPLMSAIRYQTVSDYLHAEYPVVVKDGTVYKMWYSGLSAEDGRWRIHYAVSVDGVAWQKYGMVLDLGPSGAWDSSTVAFPFVVKDEAGRHHMWYGGARIGNEYEIGYASSLDGIHWVKWGGNPVIRRADLAARLVVDPSVVYDPAGGTRRFQIWLNVYPSSGGARVYYSSSPDGTNWSAPVQTGLSPPVAPYTVDVDREPNGEYTMYFAGGAGRLDVYRTTSADGLEWGPATRVLQAPSGQPTQWDSYANYGMSVLRDNGERRMWFNGVPIATRCDGGVFGTGQIGTADEINGVWVKDSRNPILRAGGVVGE